MIDPFDLDDIPRGETISVEVTHARLAELFAAAGGTVVGGVIRYPDAAAPMQILPMTLGGVPLGRWAINDVTIARRKSSERPYTVRLIRMGVDD